MRVRSTPGGPVGQPLADVVLGARLAAGARQLADVHLLPTAGVQPSVALGQMAADAVVHRQRLLEHEQVLFAPIALQRPGDLLLAGLDAALAVARQSLWVALAGHDVADDGLPGLAHHVALAAGHVLQLPRIDQPDLQPVLLQHLEHRDPVRAGGLQRHRVHAQAEQPGGQLLEVRCHRADFAHRLAARALGQMSRHRHPVAGRPDVDARRVRKHLVFSLADCHALLHHR
jgi:hypothetical protein